MGTRLFGAIKGHEGFLGLLGALRDPGALEAPEGPKGLLGALEGPEGLLGALRSPEGRYI